MAQKTSIRAEFCRYLLVGGLAFAADFATLAMLVSGLNMHYLPGAFFAFLLGIWVNYQLSVRWVFSFRAVTHQGKEFTVFLLVGIVTLLASLALMAALVEWGGCIISWQKVWSRHLRWWPILPDGVCCYLPTGENQT